MRAFYRRRGKRLLDLALTIPALICLAPLMGLVALLVRARLGAPVLFRQVRPGLNARPFTMIKFRTMTDARDAAGLLLPDARRLTPFGRFLRATSLDELPELWNVIRGEMSLVGPRPERGVFVERFRERIPGYDQRHRVKAGMTGWAQVNGWRGNTSLRHRVQCDLYYIAHWSLALDLRILLLTLWRGIRHRNAY